MTVKSFRLEEAVVDGRRLGRHVEHDPASKAFPADRATHLHAVEHVRHGDPFDQGNLGSCTGNAIAGAINTEPIWKHADDRLLTETDAVQLYELATTLDEYPGSYPPDDTGSSGLAACKAARRAGLITSYRHAFGIDHALAALMLHPAITGVPWYEGFDRPAPNTGLVEIAGQVRGGHEFEVVGFVPPPIGTPALDGLVIAWNSWGTGYGAGGKFTFTARTWATLLEQAGDVTIPNRARR